MMYNYEELKTAMGDLEEEVVLDMLREVMGDGGSKASEAMTACQEGMNVVGQRFADGEYFVGDLIFSGELMTEAMDIIRPALTQSSEEGYGKMILCTVEGDLHDIGKNIVKAMLEAGGFEVVDLGIDTAPATIVKAAQDQNIRIIALSGVLTLAVDAMKATEEAFEQAGMRKDVKIIIGGAPVSEPVCKLVGADAWAINPADTVNTCRTWAKAM